MKFISDLLYGILLTIYVTLLKIVLYEVSSYEENDGGRKKERYIERQSKKDGNRDGEKRGVRKIQRERRKDFPDSAIFIHVLYYFPQL